MSRFGLLTAALIAGFALLFAPARAETEDFSFSENEITQAAADFFGITTEATAKMVQRVFRDQGRPNAYIKGDEGAGALVLGGRYGSGWLIRRGLPPRRVYWRGPSIGLDIGANASKSFTLIYNLRDDEDIFQRFPGVEGSIYYIAGLSVIYLRWDGITLAPIRTGVGIRAGANAQYQAYSAKRDWFPF